MIEEELQREKVARNEIAEHLKDMRKYDPNKKIKLKGVDPEQPGIKGQRNLDNQIHFR